jgi:hypothetical protein
MIAPIATMIGSIVENMAQLGLTRDSRPMHPDVYLSCLAPNPAFNPVSIYPYPLFRWAGASKNRDKFTFQQLSSKVALAICRAQVE